MSEPARILIAEDDANIALGLRELLSSEGFSVEVCTRGDEVEPLVARFKPQLLILDIMLPGRNGYDVCRDLRAKGYRFAILMLTAKSQELDKVLGLELGADDYQTKPFGLRELLARVHALLRRVSESVGTSSKTSVIPIGDSEINLKRFELVRAGKVHPLTPTEMKLLLCLHRHSGQVVKRDVLFDEVWGIDYLGTTRTLDQTVAQLRKKLGDVAQSSRHLHTVHGVGYRLEI
jgi:DNA-binding response OmpR family regulator